MRGLVRLQVIAAAGAILFARSVVADDWPYYQHDALHTGDSSALVTPQALSLVWSAPSSPTGYSTPVIVGNTIYAMQNQQGIGGSQTTVSSFDLATGAIHWSYTGNFVFPSQPGVGGGFVTFVGPTFSNSAFYVLDATTGALRYTVQIPEAETALMPTVVQDPNTGNVTAFVADGGQVSAVSLGQMSGSVLWTQTGEFGGSSIPTIVGSSIVLAGPGQYYAFDQATGAENHFWSGDISGGGGTTVAYDASRQQFYVLELYNSSNPTTLSAYHYTDNAHITLLWQRTGTGVGGCGSAAIGPTGNVYSAGNSVIWELDPATGTTLRSIPGSFANCVVPALTNNVLWIIGESQTFAYDLVTLQLLRAFNGSRGSLNSAYDSPGAFTDGYFVLDYGNIYGSPGFDVYSGLTPTPTPTATASPTSTLTPTPTPTPTASPTPTSTPTATATPTPTPSCTPWMVTLQGSITNDDPTKNSVTGAVSSCAVSPPCPGNLPGAYHYDAYQLTNPFVNPTCITVTLSDATCIYSEVYLGSFDPNNACTNYLADSDLAGNYSVTVPGSATIWVVVEEFSEGVGCLNYTVTVSGQGVCPSPTPTPTFTPTPTPTPTRTPRATPTPRSHPSSTARPTPPPRLTPPPTASPSITPAPRPTPPPHLTPPPTPTGSPRPTPAPRP